MSWRSKAASDHNTAITIFNCCYIALFMKCCVSFMPRVTGPSKRFNVCLFSPQNISPQILGVIKISFSKCERSLCFFLVSSVFSLKLSHGCHFCPSSFILLNHEPWCQLKQVRPAVIKCCSGFFCDLLNESSMHSWSHFGKPSHCWEGFATVPSLQLSPWLTGFPEP